MKMDGGHLEKTFSFCVSEVSDLYDHAQDFAEGDDRDNGQHNPLTGHQGDDSQGGAERERTGVAHNQLSRMHVEP